MGGYLFWGESVECLVFSYLPNLDQQVVLGGEGGDGGGVGDGGVYLHLFVGEGDMVAYLPAECLALFTPLIIILQNQFLAAVGHPQSWGHQQA